MTQPPLPPVAGTGAPPPRRAVPLRVLGGVVSAALVGVAAYGSISSGAAPTDLRTSVTIIAPAAAGGGWDGVAREMQRAQRANGIVNSVQVVNMPGAGGTIALGNLSMLSGRPNTIMVGGTGLLAATVQFDSATTLDDVTPLAVIVEEYDVIVVPADSPYRTLDDLAAAWRNDPKSIPWTGGGSFDQLVVTDFAVSAGVRPRDITYISSDGGGEVTQALLNGTVKAAASGYPDSIDQIEAGRLRALALVSKERVDGIDILTAAEQGYDITLTNWRMLMGPPGLTAEQRTALGSLLRETLDTPEWRDAMARYHWAEQVMTGDDLTAFLTTERERIRALYEGMES